MTDIVERLYDCAAFGGEGASRLCSEAASEIERLREALHRISLASQDSGTTREAMGREARAALKEPKA